MDRRKFLKILSESAASLAFAPTLAYALNSPKNVKVDNVSAAAPTPAGRGVDTYYLGTWRTTNDRVDGWDWSYPSTHSLAELSGNFQFAGSVSYPTGFLGRKLKKIDADWLDIEPTEGNYNFSKITQALQDAATNDFYVQLDVRQTCRKSRSISRQTCPDWLAAKLPTQATSTNGWTGSWLNDGDQDTYLTWDPAYAAYHDKLLAALFGDNCPQFPTGYRVGGYKIQNHPRMLFSMIHGFQGNSEEWQGQCVKLIADNTVTHGSSGARTKYVGWIEKWTNYWGNNKYKLCHVADDRPYEFVADPTQPKTLYSLGVGTRGSMIEHWLNYAISPHQGDAPVGTVCAPYLNSSGVQQTGDPIPVYFELDETVPILNQTLPARHLQDQNEEYGPHSDLYRSKMDPIVGEAPKLSPVARYQQNYRYSMLRSLFQLKNNIAVERPNKSLNLYGGTDNFVNPKLLNWVTLQQGHRVQNAPEAFCALIRTYTRSYCDLPGFTGVKTMQIHNIELWMKQREIYGATTVDLKRGHGVNKEDVDYEATRDTDDDGWWLDANGYPNYEWQPGFSKYATFPKSLWHIHLARKGDQIGFSLDSRFISAARNVAIKVTYFDNNTAKWNLRYKDASGNIQNTASITNLNPIGGMVKTATFFLNNFKAQSSGATLWLISPGTVSFMFMRVIKV